MNAAAVQPLWRIRMRWSPVPVVTYTRLRHSSLVVVVARIVLGKPTRMWRYCVVLAGVQFSSSATSLATTNDATTKLRKPNGGLPCAAHRTAASTYGAYTNLWALCRVREFINVKRVVVVAVVVVLTVCAV